MITSAQAQSVDARFTPDQLEAIERRNGSLLLSASAGSGKTSVLVERYARAVVHDGLQPNEILTVTFTEKAAAEMRDRIRARLRELSADEAARATEGAFISTIHGFCARLLRTHALTAGIDPAFGVLDALQSSRLAAEAFEQALEELAQGESGAVELIAAYGAEELRRAIMGIYAELRARGQLKPALPVLRQVDFERARQRLLQAARGLASELGLIASPPKGVIEALARLERCEQTMAAAERWPADLRALALPGNGAALSTETCTAYREANGVFQEACELRAAAPVRDLLDRLLGSYGLRYDEVKRARSALDFEDLELLALELLRGDAELAERQRERFELVMVDEFQDVNAVQLELIELLSRENVFGVGDAQQSIYGFRHADVELFESFARRLEAQGRTATLQTNFRSRAEILTVLNAAFAERLGPQFRPLLAGRSEAAAHGPCVELVVVEKEDDWDRDDPGLAAPWRRAEARALAERISQLVGGGTAARDIVVLTRATTDLRVYEQALEERGLPTYLIGGRGYWTHPQVLDLLCYLRALANPLDEEALYAVLVSPLVGISLDALVVIAAAARAREWPVWRTLGEPWEWTEELERSDRELISWFSRWFSAERAAAARAGIEELLDRALERTGYDLSVLALPGGQRRFANVRKLMRLAREHEASSGLGLRDFLEAVSRRRSGWASADPQESEAPVEGEALEAIRLMSIHRAKGLEFKIVCVADLGRAPRSPGGILRVSADGRIGLKLARPGTGKRSEALAFDQLKEESREAAAREERRLFYVAMTRACERLIVSGAANLQRWSSKGNAAPICWIAPALVGDIKAAVQAGSGETEEGVRFAFLHADDVGGIGLGAAQVASTASIASRIESSERSVDAPQLIEMPANTSLSYSALADYHRCGYRFYAERVLGLPPTSSRRGASGAAGALSASERGVLVHRLLERFDFRRPVPPSVRRVHELAPAPLQAKEAEEVASLLAAFAASQLSRRIGQAVSVRREQHFGFVLDGILITGVFDVLAREPERLLVVDYKSDRLGGASPEELAEGSYRIQRLLYGLAALRAGAEQAEVLHDFLEAPDHPVSVSFDRGQEAVLEEELRELMSGVRGGRYGVTEVPHRELCHGCPAEGGLCPWPLQMTRRSAAERLF